MSEIKGQLLGIILVLMVFGIIGATLTGVFSDLSGAVSDTTKEIIDDGDDYFKSSLITSKI